MSLIKRVVQKMNSGKIEDLAKLAVSGSGNESRAWARKIIQRHEEGKPVEFYALKCAREALGVKAGQ